MKQCSCASWGSCFGEVLLIPILFPHPRMYVQPSQASYRLCSLAAGTGSGGHGEGQQPLASSPGLSDHQEPGGSREGTQTTPCSLEMQLDTHSSLAWWEKAGAYWKQGKQRGPGAGDKVQPWHRGRSGQTKSGARCWLGTAVSRQAADGGWLQTASKETAAQSVQTGCRPQQRSANAELEERAEHPPAPHQTQIPHWKATAFPSRTSPWSQPPAAPWGSSAGCYPQQAPQTAADVAPAM